MSFTMTDVEAVVNNLLLCPMYRVIKFKVYLL